MTTADYAGYRDWKAWDDQSFGIYNREQAIYFSAELRRCGILDVTGMSIVEIGFGNGEFAAWARDSGAVYFGIEMLDHLVELGAKAGFTTQSSTTPMWDVNGGTPVDLIVAFDVFEHLDIEALRLILRSAHRALRPGGRLIFRVPSGDSPFSREIQHGDATHRVTIGSSMVGQLAREAGLAVRMTREPAFPLRGLGLRVFLRRVIVASLRKPIFAIVQRAFMGGGRPVLTPNMVCVLERP